MRLRATEAAMAAAEKRAEEESAFRVDVVQVRVTASPAACVIAPVVAHTHVEFCLHSSPDLSDTTSVVEGSLLGVDLARHPRPAVAKCEDSTLQQNPSHRA